MPAVQMSRVMLCFFLAASSFISTLNATAEDFHLPLCQPINHMVSLEKEGCPTCHLVETSICSGHCITKDPVIKIPFNKIHQNVCTYKSVYYKTYELPGCPPGVDPMVTYPVALSCHCSRCSMNTSDCTFQSLQPDFCVNDVPFYYYA
ncbi:lutropin subunit beta isoform X1 [Takifugu rubripes]|uniref:Gonadotropin subunit beta-2 n=1 Tax=Takifugu rubripes TaxID=31033 RepID=H2S5W6_TAKRU|nr:gonadotropin subunit beta-2 isoform X1 [Takifugu rubripes]BAV10396.1 lutropin subunit beta precursor [Takifugu rubripes]|eukprot:XP_011601356.1 PREDICTED: gonadotropin subunit beta-2 isoform X1 [Takifugu rubripes]